MQLNTLSSKRILDFSMFEALSTSRVPGEISIAEFVRQIGFSGEMATRICDYWNRTRGDVNIFWFPFACPQPILGGKIGDDDIAINFGVRVPKEMLLFILFHESQHVQQGKEGRLEEQYFQTVLDDQREEFMDNYRRLEDEANTFALESLREVGLDYFANAQEQRIRSNERAGAGVFRMMQEDIARTGATSFAELIRKQILPPSRQ